MMLQFVDNEHAGDCPTSKPLRDQLRQFHHNLKVHCGLSQEFVDGEYHHTDDMSSKQMLQKIWRLLWNKDERGEDFVDSESMCSHKIYKNSCQGEIFCGFMKLLG